MFINKDEILNTYFMIGILNKLTVLFLYFVFLVCCNVHALKKGDSESAVEQELGEPVSSMKLGSKKILTYENYKLTFKDGKLTKIKRLKNDNSSSQTKHRKYVQPKDLDFSIEPTNHGLKITKYTGGGTGHLSIPKTLHNAPVVTIGKEAFRNEHSDNLTGISIPEGVHLIEDYAFASMKNLVDLELPSSVRRIGTMSFAYCKNLRRVRFIEGTQYINKHLMVGLKTMGDGAFEYCHELRDINLPDSLVSIGDDAFKFAYKLKNVHLGVNLKEIGTDAFHECKTLTKINIHGPVKVISDRVFWGCENITKVVLSPETEKIGSEAFAGCYNLASIDLPDKLHTIGASAFSGCSNLRKLFMPESIRYLGDSLFLGCSKLKNVYFKGNYMPKVGKGGIGLFTSTFKKDYPVFHTRHKTTGSYSYDWSKHKLVKW